MIRRERASNRTQEKQEVHNKIVHCLLHIPQSVLRCVIYPVYMMGMTFYATEYSFGLLGSAVLAMVLQRFLCSPLLAMHETLKSS